ncbi:hypothetical protein EUGRSUZ_H02646 [Eucalyptus grandis]|uniref:glucan endo-1,3-beta-D-glucosidase n=2 Tax=Eucalyptus grandis TaxID=71139 RepID=A0A059B146_EUCGR|nr:hypothetical protein EUGRSUZ_H02646 [Eucalyptus grandis]
MGINYGRVGNNLPSPSQSVERIQLMRARRVKLYDADPEILKLLSRTQVQVSIMVQNQEIPGVASSQALADKWVRNNVLPYYPRTMIRFILVGNEVLSYNSTDRDRQLWGDLVPAMRRIKSSLRSNRIRNIKVGTPMAMDVVESTFPPSSGRFRSDVAESVIMPLVRFLNSTRSYFFLDVYPYFPWSRNPGDISLDFALFRGNFNYTDPATGLTYTNLLDQMLDSLIFAMERLGYSNVPLLIAETGWPNSGDIDEPGANINNAATYNRNLIKKMMAEPPAGTPARPGVVIPTFIFSLYDENQKAGPGTERHWGLLHANGDAVYEIDLTEKRPASTYGPLPLPTNNRPYKGKLWCVARIDANVTDLGSALSSACRVNGMCDILMPGRECHEPASTFRHASYAFSAYWARFRSRGATCYFDGLAEQTVGDPSRGSCKFPSVTL